MDPYLTYNGGDDKKGGSGWTMLAMGLLLGIIVMQFFMPQPQLPEDKVDPAAAEEQRINNIVINVTHPVETRKLVTNEYELSMTNVGGGRVNSFKILEPERYGEHGDFIRSQAQTDEKVAGILPLEMKLEKFGINGETQFKTISDENNTNEIAFRYLSIDNKYQFDKTFTTTEHPYVFHAKLALTNRSDETVSDNLAISMFIRQIEGEEPGIFQPGSFVAAKCYSDDDMEDLDSTDRNESETYSGRLKWFGVDESYFAMAMTADYATSCVIKNDDPETKNAEGKKINPLMTSTLNVPVKLAPNTTATYEYDIYMGPKEAVYLDNMGADRDLPAIIDYGWMEVLAKPMAWILDKFHSLTGNWGLAIILLTLIVRILLWPIAQKSQVSMMQMSKLAPKMQEIQEKYKDDPATMQQKQLELYQSNGASPFGCLPLLLQMPIFFALYRCIFVTGGLYKAPFFGWITDLSSRDPYFVLPLLSVALLVGQQLLTPSTAKNKQQKIMMYAMPLIFGLMMLALPAGLCLYMVVSSIFSMVQSFYVRRMMANEDGDNNDQNEGKPGAISVDEDGTINIEKTPSSKKSA